ncbi:MAG: hypothetical protein JSW47_06170, partial [Phycisphaerales bacterium]
MSLRHFARAVLVAVLLGVFGCNTALSQGPYQATGIKIGEVTENSAIVWTRLTERPERIGSEAPMPKVSYRDPATGKLTERRGSGRPDRVPVVEFTDDSTIETIEGAVPGAPGKIRIRYKVRGVSDWRATDWCAVDPERDYTCQFN